MDMQTLSQVVGPTTAAMAFGSQAAADRTEAASQQAMRQAQIEEILQKNAAAKEMQPYEIQAKQAGIQQTQLKNAAEHSARLGNIMGQAAAYLESVPSAPGARHAMLTEFFQSHGMDPSNPQARTMLQQMSQIPGDQLPATLGKFRDALVTKSSQFQQAMSVADLQKQSHLEGINAQGINQRDIANIQKQSHLQGIGAQIQGQKDITQMNIDAGKFNKAGGATAATSLLKAAPDKRLGAVKAILESNTNPDTKEPLTATERAFYENMYQQDVQTYNAALQARQQAGVAPQVAPGGGIQLQNKVPAQLGGPATQPQLPAGWTMK